ncbi:unnamed protein product [Mytilus coruscus]|uniref:Uncharacterized protein n=1 Tax=Mytilus coruscus TaxID=42192 RepID=A0A6J8AP02_MYTCO|nr:unnamed protein product [Mytilus coruscus]
MIQPFIDPHHIFVNNRSRCCSKGILGMGIKPDAWWDVATDSKKNGTGLSFEIAKELRDKQSNSFAQTTFSDKVEDVMKANGDTNEAEWCSLIQNWYKAIDFYGFSLDERLFYMMNIRSFLLRFLKAGHFPPHGASIAQFEGILTNVDRRLQLYTMTKRKTYNQRAISSLDSETFFSGFQDYDQKETGVLRADDISTALGAAVFLYKQRLDPKRKFYMRTSQRVRVYPENQLESVSSIVESESDDEIKQDVEPNTRRIIEVRSHHFDLESRRTKNPKRKSGTISDFGKPARGAEGARAFHKFNEEKILPHRRFGIPDEDFI